MQEFFAVDRRVLTFLRRDNWHGRLEQASKFLRLAAITDRNILVATFSIEQQPIKTLDPSERDKLTSRGAVSELGDHDHSAVGRSPHISDAARHFSCDTGSVAVVLPRD